MALEIQGLAWDKYKYVLGGLTRLMGSQPSPLDNWISNGNTYINKQLKEEFEDTKGVISICKWKDRQDKGQELGQARKRS
jgi:hypothetical protein